MANLKELSEFDARLTTIAILIVSALLPLAVLFALVTGEFLMPAILVLAASVGGRTIAHHVEYVPRRGHSQETGALSDWTLRRASALAGWPGQWLVVLRWLLGAVSLVVILWAAY